MLAGVVMPLIIAWSTIALPTWAAGEPAAAEALFKEGRSALQSGEYERACKALEESNRLDPAVGTLMNWATCEEKLGHVATAWQLWREALDKLPRGDDRVEYAREQSQALEERLPRLTIRVATKLPPNTLVYRDNLLLRDGGLNVALPLNPGRHRVVVRAPGRAEQTYTLNIAERETRELFVRAGAVASKRASNSRPTWGWVLAGAGLVSIGGAVATNFLIASKKEVVADNCPDKRCNKKGFAAVQAGQDLVIANRAAWAVGVSAFGAGTALLLLGSDAATPNQKVGLAVGPDRIGVVHRGRF